MRAKKMSHAYVPQTHTLYLKVRRPVDSNRGKSHMPSDQRAARQVTDAAGTCAPSPLGSSSPARPPTPSGGSGAAGRPAPRVARAHTGMSQTARSRRFGGLAPRAAGTTTGCWGREHVREHRGTEDAPVRGLEAADIVEDRHARIAERNVHAVQFWNATYQRVAI